MFEQYGDQMLDPATGLVIPKRLDLNLQWRKRLLHAAESSVTTRRQLLNASAKSAIFWVNAFGWTYRPKKPDETGKEVALLGAATHVPFVTWKIQDIAITELVDAIKYGHDLAIDKARDMGATWICLVVIDWFWKFHPNSSFLMLSRKESLVDRRGSMDSLFEKLRYFNKWLPNWMQPNNVRDTYMHLENRDNGSVIDGESANPNAGQASRSTATLLDEFARVPDGEAIDTGTADTAACRIFNSTPGSPTSHFTKIIRAHRCKIISLPWWTHPDKGRGMFLTEGSKVKGRGATLPIPSDKAGFKWVSPWYVFEDARRTVRNIAQNLDMEHGRVGDMVFDTETIEKHRRTFAREPDAAGIVRFDVELAMRQKREMLRNLYRGQDMRSIQTLYFSEQGASLPWRLWIPLVKYEYEFGKEKFIAKRPPQDDRYIFGVDISAGTGSSNSIVSVQSRKTGKIVAKFWDAYTSPEALAEIVAFSAAWFGGTKMPYVVFEKNGPGLQFGKKLIFDLAYPAIFYQNEDGKKGRVKTKRWGWHSNAQRKELLVGEYREALGTGKVINQCHEALDECVDYTFDDAGKITPGTGADEESGAMATHGDHVIADALTVLGSADLPAEVTQDDKKVPFGTHAQRRRDANRQREERHAWSA